MKLNRNFQRGGGIIGQIPFMGGMDIFWNYRIACSLHADLPTSKTCKSGDFEKKAQKNLEIGSSNLEISKICVK